MSTFRFGANALRLKCAVLALAVGVCLAWPARCTGDLLWDSQGAMADALAPAALGIFGGIALLCSPLVGLLTWVFARWVEVEGVRFGRAYLVVVAEIILAVLAMMCLPSFPEREAVRAAVTVAIAMILAIALTKHLLRTTWRKAVATCLLTWAMVALLPVLVFLS